MFVVAKEGDTAEVYFSPSAGRNFGSPGGGWVDDKAKAIQFARESDAREFLDNFIPGQAPFCIVRPVKP